MIDYEIIVIDDNSPDGTQDVVRQLAAAFGEDRYASKNSQSIHYLHIYSFFQKNKFHLPPTKILNKQVYF
jgi:glycosyltransferase involved in cell wall biosynthesis